MSSNRQLSQSNPANGVAQSKAGEGLSSPFPRPTSNNADEWHAWLEENRTSGNAYLAVQIAEAMDDLAARSALLDRMQTTRLLLIEEGQAVCVGGRYDGWLMWKHPDGQWVTMRKLPKEHRSPAQQSRKQHQDSLTTSHTKAKTIG